MPKYYCKSGNFQYVVDASNKDVAIRKFINKAVKNKASLAFVAFISQRGFNSSNCKIWSVIPELRSIDFPLPCDDDLVNLLCQAMHKKRSDMGEEAIQWFLYGEDEYG